MLAITLSEPLVQVVFAPEVDQHQAADAVAGSLLAREGAMYAAMNAEHAELQPVDDPCTTATYDSRLSQWR